MTNSEFKVIDAAVSDDPYDLVRLRIDPEKLETAGARKLLTSVPVRKPGEQDFIRVRPELDYRETLALVELSEDRETFIVDLGTVPELQGECFFATLFTAVSRTGVVFLWPVKVPSTDSRASEWHTSAATAAQHAMRTWVRIRANMSLGAYEISEATGNIPNPVWPEHSFDALIRIAFKDRIIRDLNHPVVKRLRGE
jgi:hypothetical protein